jgi:predicted nucleotidyltransferase
MKAVGVIVEYNPFHNGHLYHLQETKRQTGADCVIAVMSGNFLQRGEPALVSKWARTRMALTAGVDIVIELPYAFAVQAAQEFASGAIFLLDALHCDYICFGSESGEIRHFTEAAKTLAEQEEKYNTYLKEALKTGISYPKASSIALKHLQIQNLDLSKPNNILGFYYVKALYEQNSRITPRTIKRIAAGYHDQTISNQSIASATSLRNALNYSIEHIEEISPYIPPSTKSVLFEYYSTYHLFHQWNDYFSLLKYRILTMDYNELREIADIDEGLEYRLKDAAMNAQNFSELIEMVKTKRYTWTRLQRTCTHILTNFTKQQKETCKKATYIRLLGMSKNGRNYLKTIKKRLSLPLISKVSLLEDHSIYQQDKKASYAYVSVFPEPLRTKAIKEEYSTPPIQKNEAD